MNEFNHQVWAAPAPREFAGEFVVLTPLEVERDGEELFAISHESEAAREIWRYMPCGSFADAESLRAFYRAWVAGPDVLAFTVWQKATGRRVGSISLMSVRPAHGVAELGCIWYAPAAQRTKVNTEANHLLLKYCFEELGYRRMEWKCNAENAPSRRAALRLGFRYEGTFRQHMVVKGANRDTEWFSMLDREWPEARRAQERWLYIDDATPLNAAPPP